MNKSKSNEAKTFLLKALSKPEVDDALKLRPAIAMRKRVEFSSRQVETLLNQAQELLERNMREKTQYDDLRAKWIVMGLDFLTEERELAIQESRVTKQIHKLSEKIDGILHDSEEKYLGEAGGQNGDGFGWNLIRQNLKTAVQIAVDKASAENAIGIQAHSISAERDKTARLFEKEQSNLDAKKKEKELAGHDAKRFEETVEYLREIRNEKSKAICDKGGALNYEERFDALENQMASDKVNAIWRIEALYKGLQELFGYGKNQDEPAPPNKQRIEDLMTWVRNTVSWLVSFTHRDHSFTNVISIRRHITIEEWNNAIHKLSTGGATTITFIWDGAALSRVSVPFAYARVAGLSASYISNDCNEILSVDISLPRSAISIHTVSDELNNTISAEEIPIDQDDLKPCRLGRVSNRSDARPPEVAGAVSQRNASPISNLTGSGEWVVEIRVASNMRQRTRNIEDIEIEVQLNAMPIKIISGVEDLEIELKAAIVRQ